MTTERSPWWKAFLSKKKGGTPKDTASTQPFGPDFDPFAQQAEKPKEPAAAAPKTTGNQSQLSQQESHKSSSLLSDDTYDDSHLESVFNEQTCRRNMKVSRSGRFKEKRRVRSSLPLQEKETGNGASGREDIR
ncbi:proline-rich protein 15-like protein [Dicentrarchus labrax]|uniref:proline-rich protein 15-like protein n=1 Tax=Dicentrarchus labrax TaxID=13489 RepID=UPI0021F5B938|nr:proline-rich protein 15-like protein [Dicentrarchus labrax]